MITIEKILLNHDPKTDKILPVLKDVGAAFGYVSLSDAKKIAEYFSVPLSKIYETASFYDALEVKRQPPLVIEVCSGSHCAISQSFDLAKEVENFFHIKAGDQFNPKVKLKIISCLGRCGEGPIMVVNGKVYERVTRSSVHKILSEWLGN